MKSANSISATGRSPCSAIPIATPTIADSARGVSITRCLTELVEEAVRDLEDAAAGAHVLAEEDHAVVRGHLVVQGVGDRGDERLLAHASSSANTCRPTSAGSGSGASQAHVIAASTSALSSSCTRLDAVVVGEATTDQVGDEPVDRIAVAMLLDLGTAPVRLVVVVGRVREVPVGLALDQGRALAGPRPVVGILHGPIAPEHVAAVDHDARHPVARGPARDVLAPPSACPGAR